MKSRFSWALRQGGAFLPAELVQEPDELRLGRALDHEVELLFHSRRARRPVGRFCVSEKKLETEQPKAKGQGV